MTFKRLIVNFRYMTNEISLKDIAKLLGSKGGEATRDKMGKDYYKRISKLGLEARREKAKAKKEQKI